MPEHFPSDIGLGALEGLGQCFQTRLDISSMGITINLAPSFLASISASSLLPGDEYREGVETAITLSAPIDVDGNSGYQT